MTREERQAREATFPKCKCGNTLGLERVKNGVPYCGPCMEKVQYKSPEQCMIERMERLEMRVLDLEERLNNV